MNDQAPKPPKTRKPNVGSDPTKGSLVRIWQVGLYALGLSASGVLIGFTVIQLIGGTFSAIFAIMAAIVTGVTWNLLSSKNDPFVEPTGIKVADAEPVLLEFVQSIATEIAAPMPDSIYLVTDAEVAITEQVRFFGSKVEQSVLTIGLPLLQALTRQEFAALVAHELGHFAPTDVAHGPRAVRALRSARDLIRAERQGFVNAVYGSYARKMFRSVGGVGVAQEAAAEQIAAQTYGTDALLSALGRLDEIAVAFDQLLRHYAVPALQNRVHPADMFAGFGELLEAEGRSEDRQAGVQKRRAKDRNEFDLHRKPMERLADVQAFPSATAKVVVADSESGAHTLLDESAKSAEIVVGTWASKLMSHRTEPQSWQQLAEDVYSVKSHNVAAMAFDDDTEAAVQLDQAFSWSETGDWSSVDEALDGRLKHDDKTARRAEWAECVVVEAAAATASFSWRHSWDGPPVLVDKAGACFEGSPIASLLLNGQAAEARAAFSEATG